MKIKKLLLIGILLMFFVPICFGKGKKTIIQRIEEADTIPVYIMLPVIDFDKFNSASAGISLTLGENMRNDATHITKLASGDYNSLLPIIVQELNKNFKTTKFVNAPADKLPKTDKNLMDKDDPEAKLIVVFKIYAKYEYDFITKPIRDNNKILVSNMKLNGGFSYTFSLINIENKAIRNIENGGGLVYGEKFIVSGIVVNVASLFELNNPEKIVDHFKIVIPERINKHAEKLYKKDAKSKD